MALSRRGDHRGHPRYARALVTLTVTAAAGSGAGAAPAQSTLPDNNAGTGQYVEPVPDAGGDRPSRPDTSGGTRGDLPPATQRALPPGEEGRQLERLATDPGSGSPEQGAEDADVRDRKRAGADSPSKADDETAVSSITSAVVGEDGPGVPVLFLAIGLLTVGAAAVAVRRRRRGREQG